LVSSQETKHSGRHEKKKKEKSWSSCGERKQKSVSNVGKATGRAEDRNNPNSTCNDWNTKSSADQGDRLKKEKQNPRQKGKGVSWREKNALLSLSFSRGGGGF